MYCRCNSTPFKQLIFPQHYMANYGELSYCRKAESKLDQVHGPQEKRDRPRKTTYKHVNLSELIWL